MSGPAPGPVPGWMPGQAPGPTAPMSQTPPAPATAPPGASAGPPGPTPTGTSQWSGGDTMTTPTRNVGNFCGSCGAAHSPGARFCPQCGKPLS
ncbi:zinc-ribbon domain-containing protein [Mycobacterium xenopi]